MAPLLPDSLLDLLYATLFFGLPEKDQAVTDDRQRVHAYDCREPGGRLSARREMYIAASALAQPLIVRSIPVSLDPPIYYVVLIFAFLNRGLEV